MLKHINSFSTYCISSSSVYHFLFIYKSIFKFRGIHSRPMQLYNVCDEANLLTIKIVMTNCSIPQQITPGKTIPITLHFMDNQISLDNQSVRNKTDECIIILLQLLLTSIVE